MLEISLEDFEAHGLFVFVRVTLIKLVAEIFEQLFRFLLGELRQSRHRPCRRDVGEGRAGRPVCRTQSSFCKLEIQGDFVSTIAICDKPQELVRPLNRKL